MKTYLPNGVSPYYGEEVHAEIKNKEVVLLAKSNFLTLKAYLEGSLPDYLCEDELIENTLYELSSFMYYLCQGGWNKGVVMLNLSHTDMCGFVGVVEGVAERLNISDMFKDVLSAYKDKLIKQLELRNFINDVVVYLAEGLQSKGILPYVSVSTCSNSVYFKPDKILNSIRISDHRSPEYFKGSFDIICCVDKKKIPINARTSLRDGKTGSVYITPENYKSVIIELIGEVCAVKYVRVSKFSDYRYNIRKEESIKAPTEQGSHQFVLFNQSSVKELLS